MPKSTFPKVREEEIDVTAKKKGKKPFVVRWFEDNCVDSKEDILKVCELTKRMVEEQFKMYTAPESGETFAVIFFGTFKTIMEFIRKQQKSFDKYNIEIGGCLNIGYTNSFDEDNEKVGNFMAFLEYIDVNRSLKIDRDESLAGRCLAWKELNCKKNAEHCKEIQENAFNVLLQEYVLDLRTSEAVIPIFCIFLDNIVAVLKMRYREAIGTDTTEITMEVLNLFTAFYSFDEAENIERIEFVPNPTTKLALKSDDVAGRA